MCADKSHRPAKHQSGIAGHRTGNCTSRRSRGNACAYNSSNGRHDFGPGDDRACHRSFRRQRGVVALVLQSVSTFASALTKTFCVRVLSVARLILRLCGMELGKSELALLHVSRGANA